MAKKVLLLAGILLVGLVALEMTARIRLKLKHGRLQMELYQTRLDEVTGLRLPIPGHTSGPMSFNQLGFRGPEIDETKPEGTIRLAFLGASTTLCPEVSGNEATWASVVTERMRATHPEHAFDYVNAGLIGICAEESRKCFEHRVRPLAPDVVVIYHATNDLSRDSRNLAIKNGVFEGDPDRRSFMARHMLAWDLVEKNAKILLARATATSAVPRLEYDADALAETFRENLTRLVRATQETAPVVAMATFSTRFRAEQDDATRLENCNTSMYYMPYMTVDGLLRGFAAYNRVIREVAAETGAILVDGENAIPGDSIHFTDSVHLTDEGCRRMADRVFPALDASPAFQHLLASRQAGVASGK